MAGIVERRCRRRQAVVGSGEIGCGQLGGRHPLRGQHPLPQDALRERIGGSESRVQTSDRALLHTPAPVQLPLACKPIDESITRSIRFIFVF